MNETLTLSDGTVLENSSAIRSGQDLFLYMNGYGMREVFDLLIVPENAARIVYTMINGETKVFNGFSRLTAVRDEGNGLVTAVMQRETDD